MFGARWSLWVLALIALLAAVGSVRTLQNLQEVTRPDEARHPSKSSPRSDWEPWSRPGTVARLPPLTAEQVLRRLPQEPYDVTSLTADPQVEQLLQQLGALQGGEAVDEILTRYDGGACAVHAMTHILVGWMQTDPGAAAVAFADLFKPNEAAMADLNAEERDATIFWNGTPITIREWGDFGVLGIWHLQGTVVTGATRADPKLGLSLLRDEALRSQFSRLVTHYTTGLSPQSDWTAVERDLRNVQKQIEPAVPRKDVWKPDRVAQAVAVGWAQSDPDAALDWLIDRKTFFPKALYAQDTIQVLRSLNGSQAHQAVRWLEAGFRSGRVDDRVLLPYAKHLGNRGQDELLLQLVGLPGNEKHREDILTSFVEKGSRREEWTSGFADPARALESLILAARISPKAADRLRASVVEDPPEPQG